MQEAAATAAAVMSDQSASKKIKLTILMKAKLVSFVAIFGFTALTFAKDTTLAITNISSDITIETIVKSGNEAGRGHKFEIIKRAGSTVAIITKSLTNSDTTSITGSFLVDDKILLTVVSSNINSLPDKFFIQNPNTQHIEGFQRDDKGNVRPLSEKDIIEFKDTIKPFER